MDNRIEGLVRSINDSGDLVTDLTNDRVKELVGNTTVTIKFGEHETIGIFPADHGEPDSTLVAVLGQSGFVEIGIVGINLSQMLGISKGQPVVISW